MSAAVLLPGPSQSSYNGRMRAADLCPLPTETHTNWQPTTTKYMHCAAARSFVKMNNAFKARFGRPLQVDEGYRDYYTQQKYYQVYGYPGAAYPGTSNHGRATALDFMGTWGAMRAGLGSSPYVFGSTYDTWLTQNGQKYGFDRPPAMDKNGSNPEYWHYNYIG